MARKSGRNELVFAVVQSAYGTLLFFSVGKLRDDIYNLTPSDPELEKSFDDTAENFHVAQLDLEKLLRRAESSFHEEISKYFIQTQVNWFNQVFGTAPVPVKYVMPTLGFGMLWLIIFYKIRQ